MYSKYLLTGTESFLQLMGPKSKNCLNSGKGLWHPSGVTDFSLMLSLFFFPSKFMELCNHDHDHFRTFLSSPPPTPLNLFKVNYLSQSLLPSLVPETSDLLSCLYICLFWTFYIDEIMQYVLSCFWILICIMFLRFIHFVEYINILFHYWTVFQCMETTFCLSIHQLMDIMNNSPGNVHVQTFVWTCFHFFVWTGIGRSYDKLIFEFLKKLPSLFPKWLQHFIFPPAVVWRFGCLCILAYSWYSLYYWLLLF